jgi:hypothetical protein
MIRNLKVLIAAAMALAAIGVVNASGALAADFHCSVEPCKVTVKADGMGKAAHHVLVVKQGAVSASFTCNSISGEGESATKTAATLTLKNILYAGCNINGTEGAAITMNGCTYLFAAEGGKLTIQCPEGKSILIKLGACELSIGAQGPLSSVAYTNINSKKEVTVSTAVKNIKANATGCAGLGLANGAYNEGEYPTGNTIVFAEGGASVWWE